MTDERFDQLLSEMRDEAAPAHDVSAACGRVWNKLAAVRSGACGEFQAELPAYLAGKLLESRRLLIEDHLGRCPACRRAFAELKGERHVVEMPLFQRVRRGNASRWAIAAGLALIALYLGRDRIDRALAPGGPRGTVESASGLYFLDGRTLAPGQTFFDGQTVRTGPNSHAIVRLADNSLVEVNERTQFAIRAAWSGQTLQLDRGDVIIQAAKQRRGRLRVMTPDTTASVKGTVFAVSSGSAGSLVSVVEGSVQVEQPGSERLLKRGEQAASTAALETSGVRHAVSWSTNAEKWALVGEFARIEKELAAMPAQALRTEPKLLAAAPANPVVYIAIPNVGGAIRQAMRMIEQRSNESAVLKNWWESRQGAGVKDSMLTLQSVLPLLGEEIVFVLTREAAPGQHGAPLVLAAVNAGQEEALKQALDRIAGEHAARLAYRIANGILMISDSPQNLDRAGSQAGQGLTGPFAAEITARYQRGAGWLVALDATAVGWDQQAAQAGALGLTHLKYLFFEQRSFSDGGINEASLSFDGARQGVVSWLGEPGPAGSAEFITSDAILAVSASTRNPRQAFDELLALGGSNLAAGLRRFEEESGVNVATDIAAALGSDFSFAIERPSLPMPGWVVSAEMINPGVFESTVRRMVEAGNRHLPAGDPSHRLVIGEETSGGRAWTTLKDASGIMTVYWTHDRGYLVASNDRALALRAIATRDSGFPLIRSAKFRAQLPPSADVHNSGFFWLNTEGALADLAGLFPDAPVLQKLLERRDPVLIVLNGERERIYAASRTRLTSLLFDMMVVGRSSHEERGEPVRKPRSVRNKIGWQQ